MIKMHGQTTLKLVVLFEYSFTSGYFVKKENDVVEPYKKYWKR